MCVYKSRLREGLAGFSLVCRMGLVLCVCVYKARLREGLVVFTSVCRVGLVYCMCTRRGLVDILESQCCAFNFFTNQARALTFPKFPHIIRT